jgi:predicted metal-dependent hydrolase
LLSFSVGNTKEVPDLNLVVFYYQVGSAEFTWSSRPYRGPEKSPASLKAHALQDWSNRFLPALEIHGRRIEYQVIQGRSRRYTYFRFRPDLTLEVVLPRGRRDAGVAITQRSEWILEKYEEMQKSRRILDEHQVMFDGTFMEFLYQPVQDKEELIPDYGRHTVTVCVNERSRVTELVRRWFLKETSAYVMKKLSELAPYLSPRYRMADVREIKNWGYCTRTGRLSFSWQLIALPERLREYVVMHEVTHLEEFNHSAAFKKKLARLCPDYRQRERELDRVSPAELSYF